MSNDLSEQDIDEFSQLLDDIFELAQIQLDVNLTYANRLRNYTQKAFVHLNALQSLIIRYIPFLSKTSGLLKAFKNTQHGIYNASMNLSDLHSDMTVNLEAFASEMKDLLEAYIDKVEGEKNGI